MLSAAPLILCLLVQTAPAGDLGARGADPVARAGQLSWGRAEYAEWLVQREGVPLLYNFVCERIILAEAEKRGLMPTPAEVEAAYEEQFQNVIDAGYGGQLAKWEDEQVKRGYTPETARREGLEEMAADLALAEMIRAERDLSDEQVMARFREAFGEHGERTSVEVLHFSAYRGVQLGGRPDLAALKQAALERAQAAREAWVGGAKVADLLAQGDDPGKAFIEAGVIAEYRPLILGKDIDEVVRTLDKPGDVSQPIEAFDGTWLVRLRSRETVAPADVRAQLVAEMRERPVDSTEINTMRTELMTTYAPEFLLH